MYLWKSENPNSSPALVLVEVNSAPAQSSSFDDENCVAKLFTFIGTEEVEEECCSGVREGEVAGNAKLDVVGVAVGNPGCGIEDVW